MKCMNEHCDYYNEEWLFNCANLDVGPGKSMACCPDFKACAAVDTLSEKEQSAAKPEPEPAGSGEKYDPKSRYYDAGGIETLEIIKAKSTPEEYRGYLKGNAIKYLCRMSFKGQEKRDAEKILNYGKWLFDQIKTAGEKLCTCPTATGCGRDGENCEFFDEETETCRYGDI